MYTNFEKLAVKEMVSESRAHVRGFDEMNRNHASITVGAMGASTTADFPWPHDDLQNTILLVVLLVFGRIMVGWGVYEWAEWGE